MFALGHGRLTQLLVTAAVLVIAVSIGMSPTPSSAQAFGSGPTSPNGWAGPDDLPRTKGRIVRDCRQIQARVDRLTAELAHLGRVLAAAQDAQNAAASGGVAGASVPFASAEDRQFLVDRLQRDVADTEKLIGRYRADHGRCEFAPGH